MGEKIVGTEEKRKKLEEMVDNDKYSSSDMIDLIMREKAPSELNIPMENVEANKLPETAQHDQLHQINNIQKGKSAKSNDIETTKNLRAETIYVDENLRTIDEDEHDFEP